MDAVRWGRIVAYLTHISTQSLQATNKQRMHNFSRLQQVYDSTTASRHEWVCTCVPARINAQGHVHASILIVGILPSSAGSTHGPQKSIIPFRYRHGSTNGGTSNTSVIIKGHERANLWTTDQVQNRVWWNFPYSILRLSKSRHWHEGSPSSVNRWRLKWGTSEWLITTQKKG